MPILSNTVININMLVLYDQEEKNHLRKIFNAADIMPILIIPSLVYVFINILVAQYLKDALLNSLIMFLSYVTLLLVVSYVVLHYKKLNALKGILHFQVKKLQLFLYLYYC